MANGHGGARPGAGRKCDPQIAHLRNLIGTVMTDDDWIKIITGIVDDAQSGDLRSISFLLALSYGISPQSLVAAEDDDPKPAPAGTRPSPFGVAGGGLSPQGRIPTGRAEGSPSGTYGRGPASPPSAALGHKGRVASAAAALSPKVPARMPARMPASLDAGTLDAGTLDAGTLGAGTDGMRKPEGIAPAGPPAKPVIHDMRKSSQLPP